MELNLLEFSHSLPGDCPCRLSSNGMLFSPVSFGAAFDVGLFAGDWPCRLPTDVVPPDADFDGLGAGDWPCRLPTGVVSSEAAFDGLSAGDWPCRLPIDVAPGS